MLLFISSGLFIARSADGPLNVHSIDIVGLKSRAPNDGFLLHTLKTLFRLSMQSTFRSLEMHSKRCYKIFICSVILGQLESVGNY